MDEYLLKLPKGCRMGVRSNGDRYIKPPLAKIVDTQIAPRSLSKAEFEALNSPKATVPGSVTSKAASSLDREKLEMERQFRTNHLLKMRERAKDLTAESGFSDEAIACWESGIDALVAATARYI